MRFRPMLMVTMQAHKLVVTGASPKEDGVRRDHNRAAADTTGETVAGDALGDELLISVLSNIEDKRERALLIAHVGLDLPLSALARTFRADRRALKETIDTLLARLRSDGDLVARLHGVRRAGRPEDYLTLVVKLDLQDWFCAHCQQFIAQPAVGRPRKTCGSNCRQAFHRAGGTGWKDKAASLSGAYQRSGQGMDLYDEVKHLSALRLTPPEADAMRDALRRIVGTLDTAAQRGLSSRDVTDRDRALLLLGFQCPVQLSPDHLSTLRIDDVIEIQKGFEIVLRWGEWRVKQYVTILSGSDPALCPVRAMRIWLARLRQEGRRSGPLFVWLGRRENSRPNSLSCPAGRSSRLSAKDSKMRA